MTGGGTAGVLQDEGDRNENEEPVDRWFHGHKVRFVPVWIVADSSG